jgi:hypothetical protein
MILQSPTWGLNKTEKFQQMAIGQNLGTPGEYQNSWDLWMFIPLKMVFS